MVLITYINTKKSLDVKILVVMAESGVSLLGAAVEVDTFKGATCSTLGSEFTLDSELTLGCGTW
jgi:hypothetical protein